MPKGMIKMLSPSTVMNSLYQTVSKGRGDELVFSMPF